MICSKSYGVIHLFLEQPDAKYDMFALCQIPMTVFSWQELWEKNRQFWLALNPEMAKEYVFMWDGYPSTKPLWEFIAKQAPRGKLKLYTSRFEGQELKVFVLRLTAKEFQQWQHYLAKQQPLKIPRDPKPMNAIP